MAAHAASTPGSGAIQLLSWVTPFWLFGLALLPLIRWLHRGGRHRRVVLVSRLGLWRGTIASQPEVGKRQPPDPAWRRRALLTALLFIALAEPQLPQRHPAITLWVDDSLSMLTREQLQPAGLPSRPGPVEPNDKNILTAQARDTRLIAGLAQARTQLDRIDHGDVAVRALSDPWRDLGGFSGAVVATLAAGAGQKEPPAPPAALLRPDRLHWLVTDGADAALLAWPGGKRPDRVIQVASVSRNVGLERLSARRNLDDPEKFDLLLKVTNGGAAAETRELVFATDAGEVGRSTQRLDPGTSAFVSVSLPASAKVHATLQPGDELAADDRITLDLAALRKRRVATDSKCADALVAAVATHPALAVAAEHASDVQAVLDCGMGGIAKGVATIRVLAQHTPMQASGLVKWSSTVPESQRVRLDTGRIQMAARLQARPADAVLMAAGEVPVIVERAGASKLIETSLDFAAMATTSGPQIPLLVNLMFERVFGTSLLDEIAITDRGPAAARVVPQAVIELHAGPRGTTPILDDWARPLLAAAALVLLWEIVALARQAHRMRDHAGAGPA